MNNGFQVFLVAFIVLGGSWCGFVLAPELQLGTARQTTVLNSSDSYPIQRTGAAALGLQVYRANGCAACHTEQIQQDGVACEIDLTSAGKNSNSVFSITGNLNPISALTKDEADAVSGKIAAAGGKSEIHIIATGADIARGWGLRRSVADDFLYDYPVQLGSMRVGPDLANVGARLPDANWQLLHLYAPQSVVKNSMMPPFRFLFETRKIGDAPSPDALNLPKELAPPAGCEVVPTDEAKNLVAYLLSLRTDVPLYDAPFSPPVPPVTAKP